MTDDNDRPMSASPPPLFLSLWSIRHRMDSDAFGTLALLKRWHITEVELAGFFQFDAAKLMEQLRNNGIRVCSVVAPPFKTGRDLAFYLRWTEKYLGIFETTNVVTQSLRSTSAGPDTGGHEKAWDEIAALVIGIADHFARSGIRVSYHCFPHDFELARGQCFVSRVFRGGNVPSNLGLQLDTFWLNAGETDTTAYERLPVHSVHLNERDDSGRCCSLGTHESRCARYIRPLVSRKKPVNWILENDPSDDEAIGNDARMIETLENCVHSWPTFWDSLVSAA